MFIFNAVRADQYSIKQKFELKKILSMFYMVSDVTIKGLSLQVPSRSVNNLIIFQFPILGFKLHKHSQAVMHLKTFKQVGVTLLLSILHMHLWLDN